MVMNPHLPKSEWFPGTQGMHFSEKTLNENHNKTSQFFSLREKKKQLSENYWNPLILIKLDDLNSKKVVGFSLSIICENRYGTKKKSGPYKISEYRIDKKSYQLDDWNEFYSQTNLFL